MAEAELEILIKAKDEASKKLEGINGQLQGMSKQLKIAGAATMGLGIGIAGMLGMAAKAATEEQAGITKLTVAMKNVGIEYDSVKDSLEDLIDTQQQKTAIADNEQREALSKLVLATGDLTEAQDLLTVAMDMSRGMGIDLSSAADRLGMALAGNWGMLQRYIPVLAQCQTEEEKWMKLREMFAGQAEAYGKTMAGQFELMKNNLGDLKEMVGGFVLEAAAPLIEKVQGFIKSLKEADPVTVRMITQIALLSSGILVLGGGLLLLLGFLPALSSGFGILTGAITTTTVSFMGLKLALWEVFGIAAALVLLGTKLAAVIDAWASGMSYQEAQTASAVEWLKKQMNAMLGLDQMYEELAEQQEKAKLRQMGVIATATKESAGLMYLYTQAEIEWAKSLGYTVTMVQESTEAIGEQTEAMENYTEEVERAQETLDEFRNSLEQAGWEASDFSANIAEQTYGIDRMKMSINDLTISLETYLRVLSGFAPGTVKGELETLIATQGLTNITSPTVSRLLVESGAVTAETAAYWLQNIGQGTAESKAVLAEQRAVLTQISEALGVTIYRGEMKEAARDILRETAQIVTGVTIQKGYPYPQEIVNYLRKYYSFQGGGVLPYTGLFFGHKNETILPANATIELHSHIYLDGEQITESVSRHLSDQISYQRGM